MSDLGNKAVLARNLSFYVSKSGKTQAELAAIMGVAQQTFSDWLNGKKYPRIDKIETMANYFEILKSDLIEDKTKKPADDGGLSENKKALIQLVNDCPEDKAARLLQILQLFLENEAQE